MDVSAGGHRVAAEVVKASDGIDQVVLQNGRGASARVSLHGGQVLSWKTHWGEELLFTSSKRMDYSWIIGKLAESSSRMWNESILLSVLAMAIFKPPVAVRGGIPICFPQFGSHGTLEQHGFASNKIWIIDDNPPLLPPNDSNGKAYVDLLLKPTENDLKFWPHSEVRIEGLETLHYLDNLLQKERFTDQGNTLTFESEVDQVYVNSPDIVAVFDHENKRTFFIKKQGLPDVVVWNPWDKKAKALVDFGDDEYKQMLCVDGAAIEKPITLRPGEEWTGRLEISVIPST
eukprot:XP_010658897.1 PREDICTED: putative glucose-6-phosphate 1-epimerase isoform X3 [Vitis vinifera]